MKGLILAVLISSLALSSLAWAQTQPAKQGALGTNEAENLRLQMKALAELLKANVPQESSQSKEAQTTTPTSGKTVGDVLDKALDLVSGSVATIAAGVEKAAPHVWRIMIFQQYVCQCCR